MAHREDDDIRYMALALRLAERGLGRTWPNPAVGCVVVRDGRIVGRGWTQPPPGPHAEVEALRRAGPAALGATAYISLEPCAHYGRTPPCTMALLHAGVRRVVAAAPDLDPRVNGQGIAQLRQAGVEVREGVLRAQAEALNAGFFLRVAAGRPLVTLKVASSLDGRIATRTGDSRWITGAQARARAHLLRATHDAIAIGSGTALADDPALTCRLAGLEHRSPVRVVFDRRLRLPGHAQLVRTANSLPTWVITAEGVAQERIARLRKAGVQVLPITAGEGGQPQLAQALAQLAGRGITRLLVEGGATLASSFLRAGLVDRVIWFQAPLLIGGDGLPAVASLEVEKLCAATALTPGPHAVLAEDRVQSYIVRSS